MKNYGWHLDERNPVYIFEKRERLVIEEAPMNVQFLNAKFNQACGAKNVSQFLSQQPSPRKNCLLKLWWTNSSPYCRKWSMKLKKNCLYIGSFFGILGHDTPAARNGTHITGIVKVYLRKKCLVDTLIEKQPVGLEKSAFQSMWKLVLFALFGTFQAPKFQCKGKSTIYNNFTTFYKEQNSQLRNRKSSTGSSVAEVCLRFRKTEF